MFKYFTVNVFSLRFSCSYTSTVVVAKLTEHYLGITSSYGYVNSDNREWWNDTMGVERTFSERWRKGLFQV